MKFEQKPAIAVLVDAYPRVSETFVRNEARELAAIGHRVRIEAAVRGEAEPEDADPAVAWREHDGHLRCVRDLIWLAGRHPWRCLADLLARGRWRREEWPAPLRRLAPVARRLVTADVQHLHAQFATGAALDAQRLADLLGLPHSVTAHAYDIFLSPRNLREKLERASFATTGCDYNLRHLTALAPAARIERIVMGVDPDAFRRAGPPPGTHHVVAIGRLVEKKGFEDLLRAFAELDGATLTIVGDGPLRPRLEALRAELRLYERVELRGALADVREALAQADVLAAPCLVAANGDRDSMPVVIKEALAMEIPVVATDVAGVAEAVQPQWGRLVPPADPKALAGALAELLALSTEQRAAMGRAGREWVIEHASLQVETARLSALVDAGYSADADRGRSG
jgi:glycosyltransferase involved in cell wall biosynthesis